MPFPRPIGGPFKGVAFFSFALPKATMSTTLAETGSAGLSISQQAARWTSVAKRRRNTADIGNHEVASGLFLPMR